jgi:sensor c-di-GMP phosphodiesterase-like protein
VLYSSALGTRVQQRRDLIGDVLKALEQNRLDAHYQPLVRLEDHKIIGFEALCRMTDETDEHYPPSFSRKPWPMRRSVQK